MAFASKNGIALERVLKLMKSILTLPGSVALHWAIVDANPEGIIHYLRHA
jgi:hypothetical protein